MDTQSKSSTGGVKVQPAVLFKHFEELRVESQR